MCIMAIGVCVRIWLMRDVGVACFHQLPVCDPRNVPTPALSVARVPCETRGRTAQARQVRSDSARSRRGQSGRPHHKPGREFARSMQHCGVCPGVAREFKNTRHDHSVPARAMARPAVMRIACNTHRRMPVAVHIAIVATKPSSCWHTLGQVLERSAIERMIEAGS
jgi:hypothetical protein